MKIDVKHELEDSVEIDIKRSSAEAPSPEPTHQPAESKQTSPESKKITVITNDEAPTDDSPPAYPAREIPVTPPLEIGDQNARTNTGDDETPESDLPPVAPASKVSSSSPSEVEDEETITTMNGDEASINDPPFISFTSKIPAVTSSEVDNQSERTTRSSKAKAPIAKTIQNKLASFSRKGLAIIFVAAVLIIGTLFGIQRLFLDSDSATQELASQEAILPSGLESGSPDFTALTPQGKDMDELGGWVRVSPPDSDPAWAFSDTIDETEIAVSEQPLPDGFEHDPAQSIEDLAVEFGATAKFMVENTSVHIGTSANGPQSVIFGKQNLLVLIKSTNRIPIDKWEEYIQDLR